ncbi:GATA transcription factor 5 [Zea mays]|uniref:GATA transcription factor 5 n=1 Tax=Zea mays TaxID=4577 RepID=A0A3L6EFH1_MAIZE|nr:GATA transcription factor 5 [Zea mays]
MTHRTLIACTHCLPLPPRLLASPFHPFLVSLLRSCPPPLQPLPPWRPSSCTTTVRRLTRVLVLFRFLCARFQLDREGKVKMCALALRSSLRPCEAAEEVGAGQAWCRGADMGIAAFADEFSVEDLLDLEDLCEVDKDCAELGDTVPAAESVQEEDKVSSDSHGSSVLSYELMTLPVPHPMIDLPLPAHDAEELEWVSRIMDDSLAELPPPPKLPAASLGAARRPLEGAVAGPMRSPTTTICALSTEALVPVTRAKRSKRSRGSVWSLSGGAPLSESTSSSSTATTSSCSSSASFSPLLLLPADPSLVLSSHLLDETPRPKKKSKHGKHGKSGKPKKRGRKPKHHPKPPQFSGGGASAPAQGDRRCSHCGVQKTPQWRAGPEGAKTLCNACGVRYKSGRLLPEYRPACSPTFVSSIHSNSHRKVLEMRRKKDGDLGQLPLPVPAALLLGPAVESF